MNFPRAIEVRLTRIDGEFMKLASFSYQQQHKVGLIEEDRIVDLSSVVRALGGDINTLLDKNNLRQLSSMDLSALPRFNQADVEFLPAVPNPGKILCVGINYATHVAETGRPMPTFPMIFTRFADSQVGHDQAIVRPTVSHKLDYEGELAVIIGKTARHVSRDKALDYVAGYSCYNDGSVRDWQRHSIQFTPGKNFPKTGGFGPWIVTTDEIPDPQALHLVTRLNGEVMQETGTNDMIFDVAHLVEYCSVFTELSPGDVIITGTTGGVGVFREPPAWMKPGDIVEVEISGIGILRNTICDE